MIADNLSPTAGDEPTTAIELTATWDLGGFPAAFPAFVRDGTPFARLPQPERGIAMADGARVTVTVGPYACDKGELPAGVAAFLAICDRLQFAAITEGNPTQPTMTIQIALARAGMPPVDGAAVAALLSPSLLLLLGDGGQSSICLSIIGDSVRVSAQQPA